MLDLTTIEISTSSIAGDILAPDENGQQEYVITLHSYDDLDGFYDDLETSGGSITIPNRAVDVVHKLPSSRNTIYMLTADEAEQIRQDARVLAVDLTLEQRGLKLVPNWTETSSHWSKTGLTSQKLNWSLLRTSIGHEIANWGSDASPETTATVSLSASGKNVDVVIVDDLINLGHPEIAVNADGTGGSRLVQYDWGQWNSTILGAEFPNTPYNYTPNADLSNHGAHVTGIAAGNTCGWARDANVYNINPYGTSGNEINPNAYTVLEYVKQFHLNKPVNPTTGVKNPTVVNISWGISPIFLRMGTTPQSSGKITSMRYSGTVYNTTTWGAEDFAYPQSKVGNLIGTGLFVAQSNWQWGIYFPIRDVAVETTIQELIDVGCIVCGASGNEFNYVMNNSTDPNNHYNDYLVYNDFIKGPITYYPKRGNISATPNCISVGNINSKVIPGKSQSSNTGPRIDVWAPGENIVSAANTSTNNVVDPRNASYYKTQLTGTSMATPQVTGLLACILEIYPDLKQSEAKEFLISRLSTYNQIADVGNAEQYLGTFTSLDGAANRYLYFYPERALTGEAYPKTNNKLRPNAGQLWPRPRIKLR
jgi:hypothetical protein